MTLVPEPNRSNKDAARVDHAAALKRALTNVTAVLDGLSLLKGAKSQQHGFLVCCPWHSEKTPSCSVQLKDGVIVANCFACGNGGSVLDLIAAARGLDTKTDFLRVIVEAAEIGSLWDIRDAIEGKAGPRAQRHAPPKPVPELELAPPEIAYATFRATAEALLDACPLSGSVAVGLVSRGLLFEARLDGWGELPAGDDVPNVTDTLKKQFADKATKWILRGEGFAYPDHRLLIPWRAPNGTVNEIQRRYAPIYGNEEPSDHRKYVWPPKRIYAPDTRYAYGSDSKELADAEEVWLVEGAVDVLALRALNRNSKAQRKLAALGIPGVSLWRSYRASILPHVQGRSVHVAFDSDKAGEQAVEDSLADIRSAGPTNVDRPTVPDGAKDWAELSAHLLWREETHEHRFARYQHELVR